MHPFTLLGDPVRLRIVELLAGGERAVWRIVEEVDPEFRVSRSAISHHLRILRDAGFVTARADGWSRRYRLAWNALAATAPAGQGFADVPNLRSSHVRRSGGSTTNPTGRVLSGVQTPSELCEFRLM